MCPTFPLAPGPAPLFGEEEFLEPTATLTEDELAYLAEVDESEDAELRDPVGEKLAEDEWDEEDEWDDEGDVLETQDEFLDELMGEGVQDSSAVDIAERVAGALAARATEASEDEFQAARSSRWTTCLTADEAARTVRVYEDNAAAAASDPPGELVDRCSCIVMLNVGLGQLLGLPTKDWPARGYKPEKMSRRPRRVQMADLTTKTIERAMTQLVRAGRATGPLRIDFTDSRGRRAGTLAPVALRSSLLDAVTSRSPDKGCWYAFGLSLMDGYHSVMLLVDRTGDSPRVYWMDQYSRGLGREVTTTLDDDVTTWTKSTWAAVLDESKKKGGKEKRFSTPVRLWPLRKRTP
jgi:hypothetical protein